MLYSHQNVGAKVMHFGKVLSNLNNVDGIQGPEKYVVELNLEA